MQKHKQMIKPLLRRCLGHRHWLIKHVQNDWLAGTWFFLLATQLASFFSGLLMLYAFCFMNGLQVFVFTMR